MSNNQDNGNAAALREAVVALLDAMESLGCDEDTVALAAFVPDMADSSAKCLAAFRKAKDALAAPTRNCEAGSPDEQARRFHDFCVGNSSGIVEEERHKPGNAAAMREACANIAEYARTARCHTDDAHVLGYLEQIEKWAESALSASARNCDVGTAQEQSERFGKLCGKYYNEEETCNEKCPLASLPIIHGFPRCQAYWAQTPYAAEEEGAS